MQNIASALLHVNRISDMAREGLACNNWLQPSAVSKSGAKRHYFTIYVIRLSHTLYFQLLALADAAEENLRVQDQRASSLSAATRMLNMLIRLWSDMSDHEFSILEAALTPVVTENGDQVSLTSPGI